MARLSFALAFLAATLVGAALRVDRMQCEHRAGPFEIGTRIPRLTWTLAAEPDAPRGQRQTAYQIRVGTSPDPERPDLWDSGRVDSAETVLVPYAGKPLGADMDCFWQVRAWDGEGEPGPWSGVARWSMGLLEPTDWTAQWIGLPVAAGESAAPATYLRKEFVLTSPPVRARLYLAAVGVCAPVVNGTPATEDVLAPGWTEYGKRIYYRAYDVLPFCKEGANALGVVLGDGWYGLKHGGRGRTRILAQLHLELADGRKLRVVSDESWQGTRSGPIRMADIYHGEDYDARMAMPGWAEPGFAAAGWQTVRAGRLDTSAWQDVAPALRQKLADGAEAIVANNAFAGGDPIHGIRKELRIEYTADGGAASLRVPENETLHIVGGDGRPGPLRILSARYGAAETWADATAKVRAAIKDGQLRVAATNDAFGDPIYGTKKSLEVVYQYGNGPERKASAAEDATLVLAGAAHSLPRNASILRAVYGAEQRDAVADSLVEAHPGVPVRRCGEIAPVSVSQPAPGAYVFDFGQNFAGWARLTARAPAGTKVVLRFAEMLNPDGTVYTANLRSAKCTDTYVFAGQGEEIWEPAFTFHGFRYVELTGLPTAPTAGTLAGVVLRSAARETSRFACSNPLLDQLYSNILWGQRSNYLEVPTDCPQRDERLGWSGDAQIFVRTGAYLMDVAAFFDAWLRTFNDCQKADGAYPDYAPLGGGVSPAWGDAGLICPWEIYQAYGDTRQLVAHYPRMVRWIEYLRANSNALVRPAHGYGDWLHVNDETPKEVIATAYFARVTRLLARIAEIDGKAADAAKYQQLADDIGAAFRRAFVAEDGRITGDSQTAYLLGLGFGLLTDAQRQQAAAHLLRKLGERDDLLSVGFVGVNLLLPVLTEIGRPELAYRLVQERRYPSWGYSIDNGATTIWERWNSYHKEKGFGNVGMNSFNHYSFGSCGEWMFGTMAGIRPLAPGYRKIGIAPLPGPGIDWVSAAYDSVRGTVATEWRRQGEGLALRVVVPVNTTAEIRVPLLGTGVVTADGKPLEDAPGLTVKGREGGALVLAAGSGTYDFAVR